MDVPFSRELSSKLEALKREVLQETGKHVSKAQLVIRIVEQFFDKL